ncbi:MAG: YdcF family protein [Anaerolineae bacterium]|nr:YdcF family protein [Anaerolineae bacterium]
MKSDRHSRKQPSTRQLVLAAVCLYLCALPVTAFFGGRFLIQADEVQSADAVIALGGDTGFDRLEKAVQYYKDGAADVLIISDTGALTESGVDAAVYQKNAAIAMGVPSVDIYITEVHANTTYNEARATRKLMLRNGWESCIVVTDPFHTRRARAYFRDDFAAHGLSVSVTYTAAHWYRPSTWFLSRDGIVITQVEYAKLAWMWIGGLSRQSGVSQ